MQTATFPKLWRAASVYNDKMFHEIFVFCPYTNTDNPQLLQQKKPQNK